MRKLNFLAIGFVFWALSACNVYTAELCSTIKRVDIPGFEGPHKIVGYDLEKFETKTNSFTILRTAKGSYKVIQTSSSFSFLQDDSVLHSCMLGSDYFLEVKGENGEFTNYIIRKFANGTGFSVVLTAFDQNELIQEKVPYRIEERSSLLGEVENKKVLIVDNLKLSDPTVIMKLIRPTLLSINVE